MTDDQTARLREEAMQQLAAQRDAHTKKEGLSRGRRGLVIVLSDGVSAPRVTAEQL